MEANEFPTPAHEPARRAGRREANLRALNDRIVNSTDEITSGVDPLLTLLCECANPGCDDTITLPRGMFDSLHGETTRFAVIDGHVLYDVERVVADGEGWVIVEKFGEAARAAHEELS